MHNSAGTVGPNQKVSTAAPAFDLDHKEREKNTWRPRLPGVNNSE